MTDIKKTIAELRELEQYCAHKKWVWIDDGFQGMGRIVAPNATSSRAIADFSAGWCYQRQISERETCGEDARHGEFVVYLRNNITALLDYIAELEKQTQWQPIETAPKDGAIILVIYKNELHKNRIVRASWFDSDDIEQWEDPDQSEPGWYERSEVYEELEDGMVSPVIGEPTHWMPLPKPPEDK